MTSQGKHTEPNEFSHIEVRVVRNPEWLKQFEKQGFFLSENFPVENFKLPVSFEKINESGIPYLRTFLLTVINNRMEIAEEIE